MARRRVSKTDSRRFYDWVDRANVDLLCAQLLLSDQRCLLGCAFHCHQCIEKALKGYILVVSNNLVDGHNLSWLCKKAASYDNDFIPLIEQMPLMNKYYIETRYPTDLPFNFTREEAEHAYQTAEKIYHFICEQIIEDYYN